MNLLLTYRLLPLVALLTTAFALGLLVGRKSARLTTTDADGARASRRELSRRLLVAVLCLDAVVAGVGLYVMKNRPVVVNKPYSEDHAYVVCETRGGNYVDGQCVKPPTG